MAIPLIPLAAALAPVIPEVIDWIAGDDAGKKAEKIIDVAKSVTGLTDPEQAVKAINQDSSLAFKFQEAMESLRLEFAREDTKRLETVNATMRTESQSGDPVQRWWRPFWGYATGAAFFIQLAGMIGIGAWAVIRHPESAAQIIAALATLASALMTTWGIALAVLGVSVLKRSQDKAVSAGFDPGSGMLEKAVGAFQILRQKPGADK